MTGTAGPSLHIRRRPEDVPGLRESWAASQARAAYFCRGYPHYETLGASDGQNSRHIVVLKTTAGADLTLPFAATRHRHSFTLGERRLGCLDSRTLWLANPWLAEGHAPDDIARVLEHVLAEERADLLDLGEIPEQSALRTALDDLAWPARKLRIGRKESLRWLIDLPDSFEAYLKSMTRKNRKNLGWKMRRLQKDFDVRFETYTDPADVDRFLVEGERISRRTYQWNVGQQLRNDDPTRERFRSMAQEGRLRCHLLFLDGTARAFAHGSIEGDIYHDDTPGYDPDFAKYSLGTLTLLEVVRDLIEATSCRVFDFGTGGDRTGYKSEFGTRYIVCNSYYVLNAARPRAMVIMVGQTLLAGLKNLAAIVISDGKIRSHLRRRLRKYGD